MIKYHIEISDGAEKELRLADNPRPHGFKKLFASNNYRIRVGNYRIIYTINDSNRIVKVLDIGHRKDIYR